MKIISLAERKKTLRVLAYGKPGSGKSTFAASAALDKRTSPVLHIDYSGNPESFAEQEQLPTVITLQQLAELNAIYDWFYNGQPLDHPVAQKVDAITGEQLTPPYRTLVFDGITAVQRRSFDLVLGVTQGKPGSAQPLAEWTHYRSVLAQMLAIAGYFYQTLGDLHIIMTALEHEETRYQIPGEKDTAFTYAEPGLQGQAVTELPGEALLVMRFAHKSRLDARISNPLKAKYSIAQLQPSLQVEAKDQYTLQTPYIADPTVTTLLNLIEAKRKHRS